MARVELLRLGVDEQYFCDALEFFENPSASVPQQQSQGSCYSPIKVDCIDFVPAVMTQ
jgi:hypothetical protein